MSVAIKPAALAALTQEQQAAVQRYAAANGARWRSYLRAAWESGSDTIEPMGHALRQIRNQHGPAWLARA